MPVSCCAYNCTSRKSTGDSTSFFRVPADRERRRLWIAALRRKDWQPNEYSRVCSKHFVNGLKSDDPLSPNYVPTIFDWTKSPEKRKKEAELGKFKNRLSIKQRRTETQNREAAASGLLDLVFESSPADDPSDSMDTSEPISDVTQQTTAEISTQTDLSSAYILRLESECQQLRNEVLHYRAIAKSNNFCKDSFEKDDERVKFCTGLPSFAALMALFTCSYQHFREAQAVTKFQLFILTLMKLRLDVPFQLLGYIFGLHTSTVSRIFQENIDVMNTRLVPHLVFWPEREELRKTLPMTFRQKFAKCASIIDCFEIFIQRPSDLQIRANTYSQYKSHNTVKYLISIAPQGVITFISKGWGGRTSDVFLTENCGFLNNILPGDVILADRGFTISDSVAFCNAELKIPAFTKGKQQLSALDVETSRVLASVRIHVERVIGMVRQKYTMLESTIPITFLQNDESCTLTTLDKIVRVACALTNVSQSCVPFE